jgi:signal transduction histidine kinase/CheY-like chemotaxis protein/streptogramin lyase
MKRLFSTCFSLWLVVLLLLGSEIRVVSGSQLNPERPGAQGQTKLKFEHALKLDMPLSLTSLQDRDGFLWFGSQNGLIRYDGYSPLIYRYGPDGLSGDMVSSISEGPDGSIWIGINGSGLTRFDKQNNKFTHYLHDPANPDSLISDTISYEGQSVYAALDGSVWVATQGSGLDRLNPATGKFTHFQNDPNNPNTLSHNLVWSIIGASGGAVWVGTAAGLDLYDPASNTFTHYLNDPQNPNSIGKGWITRLVPDKFDPNILWIGAIGSGLNRMDIRAGTFKNYSHNPAEDPRLNNDEVVTLLQSSQGLLYIGWYRTPSDAGLDVFNPQTETFTHNLPDPNDPTSLAYLRVYSLLEDRAGALWIGMLNGAIDKLDPNGQKFDLYQHTNGVKTSLSSNSPFALFEDSQKTIWIGSLDAGLQRYNPASDDFTGYHNDPQTPNSLPGETAMAVFEDSAGDFYVATRGGALCQFNRQRGLCDKIYLPDPNNPKALPLADSVRSIVQDKFQPNILWMAAYLGGLVKFDKTSQTFTTFYPDLKNPNALKSNNLHHIYCDADGILWISGSGDGLVRFDPRTEQFKFFTNDQTNPQSLGTNNIWETQEFTPGYLWLATNGGGLEKFNKQTGETQIYNKKSGFPANTILTIRQDPKGLLWAGTDEGLVRFDPQTSKSTLYKKSDGLQGDVFLDNSALSSSDGRLWFGGLNGLNAFYPDQIKDNTYIPPVVLTSLKQGNLDLKLNSGLTNLKSLELDWQQNFFEFEYAALNYTHPEKNQYAYKLEGFDKDWYEAGNRRFGRYSGLPAGDYTLRIKGSNNDGLWNEKGISLPIKVVPPFWETIWFRTIALALLIGALAGAVLLRLRTIQAQKRELEVQVEKRTHELQAARLAAETANQAKSTFLANMSHELRTPLNAILGYTQILQRQGKDPSINYALGIIQHSGEHLLTLINDILNLSKIEANKLDLYPARIDFKNFLNGVAGIIQSRADIKGLTFVFKCSPDLPLAVQADETRLREILLNLLGNAVKFTDHGQVTWRVTQRQRVDNLSPQQLLPQSLLRFEVIDTGVGIPASQLESIFTPFEQVGSPIRQLEGTGLGLSISRRLVRLMGSELHVTSQPGQGSTFWFDLSLPVTETIPAAAPQRTLRGYLGPRRKVLIADDIQTNREILLGMLQPLGFEVLEACDGQEAVELARQHNFDLILMDQRMPVLGGLEAVRLIRRIPGREKTPILAVSGSVSDADQALTLASGYNAFLPKPLFWTALAEQIQIFLALEWEYEDSPLEALQDESALTPPPPELLQQLYQLALMGDISALQDQAVALLAQGEPYTNFAKRLKKLAETFEERAILNFIKTYL